MELLVVIAIVAILSMVGLGQLRPRTTDSVRSVMAEVEGLLLNAQNSAYTSTQDIYITAAGSWLTPPTGNLVIDARPMNPAIVTDVPPSDAELTPNLTATTNRLGAPTECFQSLYSQHQYDHTRAGIDTTGAWATTALAGAAPLAGLKTFTNNASFSTGMTTNFTSALATPLCTGAQVTVVFSGISRQYLTGFCVTVVGLNSAGAVANGPMGVLVVPAGGANIYKYFKPDQSSNWGRM